MACLHAHPPRPEVTHRALPVVTRGHSSGGGWRGRDWGPSPPRGMLLRCPGLCPCARACSAAPMRGTVALVSNGPDTPSSQRPCLSDSSVETLCAGVSPGGCCLGVPVSRAGAGQPTPPYPPPVRDAPHPHSHGPSAPCGVPDPPRPLRLVSAGGPETLGLSALATVWETHTSQANEDDRTEPGRPSLRILTQGRAAWRASPSCGGWL